MESSTLMNLEVKHVILPILRKHTVTLSTRISLWALERQQRCWKSRLNSFSTSKAELLYVHIYSRVQTIVQYLTLILKAVLNSMEDLCQTSSLKQGELHSLCISFLIIVIYFIALQYQRKSEYYGSDSRCVETDGSRSYSLCLQTKCNENLGLVQIIAGGQRRTCEYDGQIHTILFQYDGDGPLRIKCPKATLVCPELFCPANCAGRGDCLFRSKGTISTSEPQARCVCDSPLDTSNGCFYSELSFPAGYGYGDPTNQYHANKALFLLIVGSLVAGLAVIFVVVRQWKARQNLFM
jgi:hypothetical protein